MKRDEFIKQLSQKGWGVPDRWGNYKSDTGKYRIKINPKAWRLERKIEYPATQYSKASVGWVRIGGDYYKHTIGAPERHKYES